jgi:uncharacterized membrane protein (UPF0127 family)
MLRQLLAALGLAAALCSCRAEPSLAADEGMIFPFARPQVASFWMRNTLIPLDMIFIRADGTIARIAANTIPHNEESVTSGEPVVAVLEIKGGRSAELGLSEGDRVTWQG